MSGSEHAEREPERAPVPVTTPTADCRQPIRRSHTTGLMVGAVDDPAERAADRMADRVLRGLGAGPPLQVTGQPTRVRRASAPQDSGVVDAAGPEGGPLDADTAGRIRRASGGGQPLEAAQRPSLESAFGRDFGRVRLHTDSEIAPQIGATAFAHGDDIHFAPGAYRPDTTDGLRVLSHELAHVVQDGGSPVRRIRRLMSAKEFRSASYEGKLRVRGSTAEKIDELLTEYDQLRARGGHLAVGANGLDRAISILTHITQDVDLWVRSHAQDSGRQTQRAGLLLLRQQARDEIRELTDIRAAAMTTGMETAPLTVADNVFKQKMDGSASSVFQKLAPVISAAIPSPGDSAEIEAAVEIPVDPSSSAYVGLSIRISAARNDRTSTNLGMAVEVSGGAKVHGSVNLGLALGAFIEAHGKDPKSALQLLSWGWYRRVRESLLPREVANFMWGGSTGSVGWVRAEDWAAKVEEENFVDTDADGYQPLSSGVGSDATTDAYVRTGASLTGSASGSVGGVAELEGSAALSGGTHYDHRTVTSRKNRRGAQLGKAEQMPERGKNMYLGTHFVNFEVSAGVTAGPFSGSINAKVEGLRDDAKKEWRFEYLSGGLSAGATLPLNASFASKFATTMVALGPQMFALVKKAMLMAQEKDKSGKAEGLGELVNTGDALAQAFGAWGTEEFELDFSVDDSPMDSLEDSLGSELAASEDNGATLSLDIAFGKNYINRSAPVAIDLTLNSERVMGLDVSVASFSVTRGRRLMRFRWEAGNWKPKVD